MDGLKAIIEWFPKHRIALVNGAFIALGTAGAVTATAPVDWILGWLAWRRLFLPVAATTTAVALLMLLLASSRRSSSALASSRPLAIRTIYADPSFWRVVQVLTGCSAPRFTGDHPRLRSHQAARKGRKSCWATVVRGASC